MEDVRLVVEGGPDAGRILAVLPGRRVIGRSPTADVTIADPALELHHVVLDGGDGEGGPYRLVQLTGRVLARVDGVPVDPSGTPVPDGATIVVGATRLRLRLPSVPPECFERPSVCAGEAPPQTLGARWTRWSRRPPTASDTDGDRVARAAWLATARAAVPDVAAVLAGLAADPASAWSRRIDGGAMFHAHIGVGAVAWSDRPSADGLGREVGGVEHIDVVDDAPVVADLGPRAVLQLVGPGAAGVARALVVQLAVAIPADHVRLRGVGPWADVLAPFPHADTAEPVADAAHIVLVADAPGLAARTLSAERDRFGVPTDAALVLVDEAGHDAAWRWPGSRLVIGARGAGRWWPAVTTVAATSVHVAGVAQTTAEHAAVALVGRLRPRPPAASPAALAEAVGAAGLDDAVGLAGAWRRAAGRPAAWLGRTADGPVFVDFAAGPVVIVGDEPTNVQAAVETMVLALAAHHPPDVLELVLGDDLGAGHVPHATGRLAPARLFHELARPRPRSERTAVVAIVAPPGAPPMDDAAPGPPTGTDAVALVVGVTPDHPWAPALLGDPTATLVAVGLRDAATARRLVGDTRATRLAPGQVVVRSPGAEPRLLAQPSLAAADRARLAATIRHAATLRPTPGVRSCTPCPDADSPWEPPSSVRSCGPTPAPMSWPGSSPCSARPPSGVVSSSCSPNWR